MDTYIVIIALSVLLIISYLFQVVAKKTSVPAVLLLMVLGIVSKLILPDDVTAGFDNYLGLLGKVGLILIVLEASIDLRLRRDKIKDIFKAFVSALVGLLITVAAITVIIGFSTGTDWKQAGLYAIPFAVMSSAIVIPSVGGLFPKAKEFIIYESSLSDILGIIMFNLFMDLNKSADTASVFGHTSLMLIGTIFLALVLSYALIWIFVKIQDDTKLFLMISSLLLFYAIGGYYHLSALIMVMIFGLILGNPNVFFRGKIAHYFDTDETKAIAHNLHHISLESAFVIKTFFFFLFGLSIKLESLIDLQGILLGILFVGVTYGFRFVILYLLKVNSIPLLTMITPRGLISVLLFFSIPAQFIIADFGDASMLITIMATNIIMTFGLIQNKKDVRLEKEAAGSAYPITPEETIIGSFEDPNTEDEQSVEGEENKPKDPA